MQIYRYFFSHHMALFGALSSLLMTIFFLVFRILNLTEINWEMGLGTILTQTVGIGTWFSGLSFHLLNGELLALLFAWVLRKMEWGGFKDGLLLGLAYWFFISIMMGEFPALNLLVPPGASSPGPFGAFYGHFTFYALLAAHLFFGGVVGWAVGRPKSVLQDSGWR